MGGVVVAFMTAGVAALAATATLGWYGAGFRPLRQSLSLPLLRQLALGGLPFLGATMAQDIYSEADKILLGILSRDQVIGWYAAGN
jgi:O-antigen/teichoic acid export membrane protein